MINIKFEFPDTGEGVTEGQFLEWKVEVGDTVEEDQVVGEAETDKAVVEIPAPADGTVEELKASPGDNIEVGDVIMILDTGDGEEVEETGGEDTDEQEESPEEQDKEQEKVEIEPEETEQDTGDTLHGGDVLALPKVRKLAEEKGVDLASIKTGEMITEEEVIAAAEGSEPSEKPETEDSGQSSEEPVPEEEDSEETGAETPEDVMATPAVRKLAREKNVDIGALDGSGRGGKVTREDVIEVAGESSTDKQDSSAVDIEGKEHREDMSQLKKTVADRMAESRFTAPHVTHFDTADVTELVELREEKKEKVDAHLTYLPFIMKAVQLAMNHHPELNSELDEEDDSIVLKGHYDFNIAVDTERGLMTPIIREVDDKNVVDIAEEVGEKAEKARSGNITPEEMENGTFSITNVGAIGGEEFTPIINYPQAAILGIGKIQDTAEVVEGEVVPRKTVKLSLSYDHRIIDGAKAARFMNTVIENLEDPENMILEL